MPPKNSKNGTNFQPVTLTAQDIISIVKECRSAQVLDFKYAGLELKFEHQQPVILADEKLVGLPDPENEQLGRLQVEQKLKAYELDRLMIEDPVAYEELRARDLDTRDKDTDESEIYS